MKELLFLVHRIPYPPDKGDKIRSFHMLRYLSRHYRVHLGSFIDDEDDWRHRDAVEALCASTCLQPLQPTRAKIRSLSGLLTGQALTLPYYRNRTMRAWVNRLLDERPVDRVVVFSSAMAQYLDRRQLRGRRSVLDFVDVDSDKWRQYSDTKGWPLNWLYRREARRLLEFDREMARRFDASLFVSPLEAGLFRELAPDSAGRIDVLRNGVDAEYFSPERVYPDPYPGGSRPLVFVGAMDYWPNVDAVVWFADEVLPHLRQRESRTEFYIVGTRPDPRVRALGERDGITVTGRVDDVRPYIARALGVVAPLRVARGVQNKVLEAMAMARPVIATPLALEGIDTRIGEEVLCADQADDFSGKALALMHGDFDAAAMGRAARRRVLRDYDWQSNLERLRHCLEGSAMVASAPESL
jgi:sugar transferase (PEP-CTERM/EpsH1 system associated)